MIPSRLDDGAQPSLGQAGLRADLVREAYEGDDRFPVLDRLLEELGLPDPANVIQARGAERFGETLQRAELLETEQPCDLEQRRNLQVPPRKVTLELVEDLTLRSAEEKELVGRIVGPEIPQA